ELGWADLPVRSDRAIGRHWARVCGAVSCCWWAEGQRHAQDRQEAAAPRPSTACLPLAHEPEGGTWRSGSPPPARDRVERAHQRLATLVASAAASAVLAPGAAAGAGRA